MFAHANNRKLSSDRKRPAKSCCSHAEVMRKSCGSQEAELMLHAALLWRTGPFDAGSGRRGLASPQLLGPRFAKPRRWLASAHSFTLLSTLSRTCELSCCCVCRFLRAPEGRPLPWSLPQFPSAEGSVLFSIINIFSIRGCMEKFS